MYPRLTIRPGGIPLEQRGAIEQDVRRFITENFPLGGGFELGGGDSLLEAGVIDSVGVLELIEHLESTYGFQIPDADVLPENLDSIDAIAQYVLQRLDAVTDDAA